MSTKRTPLARPLQHRITDTALQAFHRMRELENQCMCPPRDWDGEYWKHQQCKACGEWYDQHDILHRELAMPPWRWPCVEHPRAQNPYPEGSPAAARWAPNKQARALWRALEAAERASSHEGT
jgi:hypothetical protein